MARQEWSDPDIAEGLMLDEHDRVISGTMSNLFLLQRGELWTPDLSRSGVSGILRDVVLAAARQLNIPVQIKELKVDDITGSDALFLTNSLIGVWPIRELAGESFQVKSIRPDLLQIVRQQSGLE
jgi:4-amino-4-deoxychorismate lyase